MKFKSLILSLSASIFLLALFSHPVFAIDPQIYDTSDHYLGACGFTDTTTWELENTLNVTTFQIWYKWNAGEEEVAFTLNKDGAEFLTGEVTRSECDPYQTSWCNGNLEVNKKFPQGSYDLKVAAKRQCAIPSGNGTVRLYGTESTSSEEEVINEDENETSNSNSLISGKDETTYSADTCNCNISTESTTTEKNTLENKWSYYALGASVIANLGLIVFLVIKKNR